MGEKGEGSGGEGGGKWGERGRELGMGYPPVHPLRNTCLEIIDHCYWIYRCYDCVKVYIFSNLLQDLVIPYLKQHQISTAHLYP